MGAKPELAAEGPAAERLVGDVINGSANGSGAACRRGWVRGLVDCLRGGESWRRARWGDVDRGRGDVDRGWRGGDVGQRNNP